MCVAADKACCGSGYAAMVVEALQLNWALGAIGIQHSSMNRHLWPLVATIACAPEGPRLPSPDVLHARLASAVS